MIPNEVKKKSGLQTGDEAKRRKKEKERKKKLAVKSGISKLVT